MKKQTSRQYILSALIVLTFLLSSFPNVYAQTWVDSEIHGAWLCDPLPPTQYVIIEVQENDVRRQELVELKNGLDLSNQDLRGIKIWNCKLEDVDFSYSDLSYADLDQAVFVRCNFHKTKFYKTQKSWYTFFIDCRFDRSVFSDIRTNDLFDMPSVLERNQYVPNESNPTFLPIDKKIDKLALNLPNFDPNKTIVHLDQDHKCVKKLSNKRLVGVFPNLTKDRLMQTLSYQEKMYYHVTIIPIFDINIPSEQLMINYQNTDFSNALFINCNLQGLDLENANLENAMFIDSQIVKCANLTKKQIESTWNWKHDRMDWLSINTELK